MIDLTHRGDPDRYYIPGQSGLGSNEGILNNLNTGASPPNAV